MSRDVIGACYNQHCRLWHCTIGFQMRDFKPEVQVLSAKDMLTGGYS